MWKAAELLKKTDNSYLKKKLAPEKKIVEYNTLVQIKKQKIAQNMKFALPSKFTFFITV